MRDDRDLAAIGAEQVRRRMVLSLNLINQLEQESADKLLFAPERKDDNTTGST